MTAITVTQVGLRVRTPAYPGCGQLSVRRSSRNFGQENPELSVLTHCNRERSSIQDLWYHFYHQATTDSHTVHPRRWQLHRRESRAQSKSCDPRRDRMPHRRGAIARAAPFRGLLTEHARLKPPTTPIPCGSLANGSSADRKNAADAAVRAI